MKEKDHGEIPTLTPILHPWIKKICKKPLLLQEAIDKFGSPVNIHSLTPFEENIRGYQDIFKNLGLKHQILFARKANKCLSFPIASAQLGEGVDTASHRELEQCLDAGISPKSLVLTAAVKNKALFELAVENKVTVVLDNLDELDLLKKVVHEKRTKANVNLRLGGFLFHNEKLHSRFGFSVDDAFAHIKEIRSNEPLLDYTGLHFHLNGYSIEQRAAAVEQCIQLIDRLKSEGIPTYSMDIGGGLLVNYLSDKSEWEGFHGELKKAVLGKRAPVTYLNDALGMVKIGDQVHGEPTVYPFYNELNKVDFLMAVLTTVAKFYRQPIYRLLRERQIELRMEPGRSLLDQCGVTVAKVAFRKRDSDGNLLVGLEMNRTQLRSSSADFLLDPLHLPQKKETVSTVHGGYLMGAYCLEQELILKRKVAFPQFPEIGDLVIFPNTAGYMMHFFESEAHLFPLAKNLFVKGPGFQIDDGEV